MTAVVDKERRPVARARSRGGSGRRRGRGGEEAVAGEEGDGGGSLDEKESHMKPRRGGGSRRWRCSGTWR